MASMLPISCSSSTVAGSKPVLIALSTDDEQEVCSWKVSSPATSNPNIVTLSSDDEQEVSSWKRSSPAKSKTDVINLSSSGDKNEASSCKMSSCAGSKDGPVVLTSSSYDGDAELLDNCRKRRAACYVPWVFSDEVKILTMLAAKRLKSVSPALLKAIRHEGGLYRENPTARVVKKKVSNLRERFKKRIASGGPSSDSDPRDKKLYDLSSKVWPELLP